AYAPEPSSYQKGMRMLRLLEGGDFTPPPWVVPDVGVLTVGYGDVQNVFANCGSLLDALYGQPGGFQRMLKKARTAKPPLDVEKAIVARLGRRVLVVRDVDPASAVHFESDRLLFAFETTDEKRVAEHVERFFRKDSNTKRHVIAGRYDCWETVAVPREV